MKILIVDDNEDARMILRKTLQHDGYEVDEAPNGIEALKISEQTPPDIIVSDVLMPEMDGFRLCRKIKQNEQLRKVPFIFYTSTYTDPKNENLAMSLGAVRYIIKPIAIDKFLEIIREISGRINEKALDNDKTVTNKDDDLMRMYEDSIVSKLDKKIRELQLYKEIFANSNDAIFVMDSNGRIIQQNSAHRVLTGYANEELTGKSPALYLGKKVFSEITKKLSLMGVYRGDLIASPKEGEPIHIELSAFSIADEKGKVTSHIGIERDITKRKLAEMEIHRQAETLKIINTVISDASSTLALQEVMHKISKNAAELTRGDGASISIFNNDESKTSTSPYLYNVTGKLKILAEKGSHGFVGKTGTTDEPVIINNYPVHPDALKEYVDAGVKTLLKVPLISRGITFGTLCVFGRSKHNTFSHHDMSLLESLGKQAAIAIENASLYENLEQSFISTVTSLASIIDAKSPWTKGHAERVRDYAVAIGTEMGLDQSSIDTLRIGGLLHDIGKIGTFDTILDKPDKLTSDELKLMHQHPVKGAEILSPILQLKEVVPLVKYHHEKVDGTGYPEGLKNDEIPLLAKIVCVADAFDSLAASRPYRESVEKKEAIEEIRQHSGTQFEPSVVDAFLAVMKTNKVRV